MATCSDSIVDISRVTCAHCFSDDMLWWYFKQEWKNNWDHSHFNEFQMTASTVLIQQVPLSFSRYRSLAYILMSRYLLFKLALPFSLARTYKRLVQPYRGFLRLCRYSKTFLRTFLTPCAHSVDASFTRCRLNGRKLNTYRETRPPSWENGTWQVPSQLSHSEYGWSVLYFVELRLPIFNSGAYSLYEKLSWPLVQSD